VPVRATAPPVARVKSPITIVLIDDNPLESISIGIVARIRTQPGFRVLATATETGEALRQVRETRPDIVLLDLPQDDDDSLTLAGALHGETPQSRVIVMGLAPMQTDLASLVRAGVSGFVMAGASFENFLGTIRSVSRGIQVLPLELTRTLFSQLNQQRAGRRPRRLDIKLLTAREREVADLVVLGLSNRQIAARLTIALHTVKNHVRKVLSKLAVNSRLEIAAFSQNGAAAAVASGQLLVQAVPPV
jgi:two-component system, NarL family, response regulator DevR